MDYKLHVEQYRNGNSCCTLFNDLKISEKKKIRWEKRRSLYTIHETIITLISAC